MNFGVVFGGGGVLGISWEVGVLAGLSAAGIDPVRDANVVVGTSAGSVLGARTCAGIPVAELVAGELAPPGARADTGAEIMGMLDYQLLADIFVRWTGTWPMTDEVAREVGELSLKQTTLDDETYVGLIRESLGAAEWPARDLRVVTSSCDTGQRTPWTGESGVSLERAVAASCAIPGISPPITVDPTTTERYVDGGVWSGTNADLLFGSALDAVLVIEPLSVSTNQLGALCRQALTAETAALEAEGTKVHVISGDDAYGALSTDLLNPGKRPEALALGRERGEAAVPAVRELFDA